MANSNPQRSDNQDADALREALHGRAEYMERKFKVRRAHDIKPDYLQQTLDDIGSWSASPKLQRSDIVKARSAEDLIYAAITIYEEPDNRETYFRKLRVIADQLKRI